MKTKYLIMLSEIIDKMGIKDELKKLEINTGNELKDNEELGKEVIALLIANIYKCETEVYTFVASYKNYLPNKKNYIYDQDSDLNHTGPEDAKAKQQQLDIQYEKDYEQALEKASEENIVPIFKSIAKLDGVGSFLA